MNEYIFNGKQVGREGIPGLLIDYNQMRTADFYVYKIKDKLDICAINIQRFPYTVTIEKTYERKYQCLGVHELISCYSAYDLLAYIRSKRYEDLVEAGWMLGHFLYMEEVIYFCIYKNSDYLDPNLLKNYGVLTGGYCRDNPLKILKSKSVKLFYS